MVSFSYISAIEQRVEDVEETLLSLQRQISGLPDLGHGKSTALPSFRQSSVSGTGQLEVQELVEISTESVDAMAALVVANDEETGFFG